MSPKASFYYTLQLFAKFLILLLAVIFFSYFLVLVSLFLEFLEFFSMNFALHWFYKSYNSSFVVFTRKYKAGSFARIV